MNGNNKAKNHSKMIIYTTEDGLAKIETTFDGDTVWLSIDQMAELFQRDRSVIGKHVRSIFKEGELRKEAVWAKFAYLDFAERQAEREQAMTMQDWSEHLDRILTMSGEQLLNGNGSVSHQQAIDKATGEYRKYKARTLSEVERDYLDAIKLLEEKIEKIDECRENKSLYYSACRPKRYFRDQKVHFLLTG